MWRRNGIGCDRASTIKTFAPSFRTERPTESESIATAARAPGTEFADQAATEASSVNTAAPRSGAETAHRAASIAVRPISDHPSGPSKSERRNAAVTPVSCSIANPQLPLP